MIRVIVTTRGLDRYARSLRLLSDPRLLKSILGEGVGILKRNAEERFDRETDPEGQHWTPLKPNTVKRKGHAIILKETGRLRGGFHISGVNQYAMAVRNTIPWGQYAQYGTKYAPPRVFMGVSDKDDRDLESMVIRRLAALGLG